MAHSRQLDAAMACRCLNIRISPHPDLGKPPDFLIADSDYALTYVGEQGIVIVGRLSYCPQIVYQTAFFLL